MGIGILFTCPYYWHFTRVFLYSSLGTLGIEVVKCFYTLTYIYITDPQTTKWNICLPKSDTALPAEQYKSLRDDTSALRFHRIDGVIAVVIVAAVEAAATIACGVAGQIALAGGIGGLPVQPRTCERK